MIIPAEMSKIILLIGNGMIWVYIGLYFLITYLFISLLTWSFVKPLKYIGIPTLIVGLLFIIFRFASTTILNFIQIEQINIIKVVLPKLLKPILINGIICLLTGVVMIVLYIIISNIRKNKEEKWIEPEDEPIKEVS